LSHLVYLYLQVVLSTGATVLLEFRSLNNDYCVRL
jgi:hypothetical protein